MTVWEPSPRRNVPMAEHPIYLDYQAATPVDPRVCEAMLPWLGVQFGNPHATHIYGQKARQAVEQARAAVAALIGAQPNEIIFTSGATEANNLAIKGAMAFQQRHGGNKHHIITLATEHASVLQSCADYDVISLPVDTDGLLDIAQLHDAIRPDTLLVSVMAVNNEIGVIQNLADIGALCKEKGIYFHTDAAQAFGKIPLDVEAMAIDMLSISGHKAYAPAGIGVLYVRRTPRTRLEPLFSGGGQERALRPGTVATALAVALGKAAAIAHVHMQTDIQHVQTLQGILLKRLDNIGSLYHVYGSMQQRYAGNMCLRFEGVDSVKLVENMPMLACSTGSACSAAQAGSSHVLKAVGCDIPALRLGFGRFTTPHDIENACDMLEQAINNIQ